MEELQLRLKEVHGYGPRLSVLSAYHSCPGSDRSPGVIPQNHCKADGLSDRSLRRLAAHISRNAGLKAELDVAHAGALIDMLSFGDSFAINRAISNLKAASMEREGSVPILSDLAAAHLYRAQKNRTVSDLTTAIDAAAKVLEIEPENRPALFNLALGLHWFGLEIEAGAAWRQFLSVDSTSEWAYEARAYFDELYSISATAHIGVLPGPWISESRATGSELTTFTITAPAEARAFGLSLLGMWGMALLRGEVVRAASLYWQASVIADVLKQRSGDATLADAVQEIRLQLEDPSTLCALADGYAGHAFTGEMLAGDNGAVFANRFFRHISTVQSGSALLKRLAKISFAETLVSQDSLDRAMVVLQQLTAETDTIRYPSISGDLSMRTGRILVKKGLYEEAMAEFAEALRYFERMGEPSSIGSVQLALAKIHFQLGHADSAHELTYRALGNLRMRGRAKSDALYLTTQIAIEEGYSRAAVLIQSEGLQSSTRIGGRNEAEARLLRARALSASGKSEDAAMDAQRAGFFLEFFGSGEDRRSVEVEILLIEAEAMLHVQPRRAAVLTDSILRFASATNHLSAALALRSEARLALGELDRAVVDLYRAATLAQLQPSDNDSVSGRVGALSRRLVMGYVNAGRSLDALKVVEELRAGTNRRESRQSLSSSPPLKQFESKTVIEYVLIEDTLLTWTIAGSEIHLARSTVSRQKLSHLIAATRLAMEFNQGDEVLLPYLQTLHELLIEPVRTRIGGAGTSLVIVTDGEMGSVPFSALHDVRRGRYLLEDHPLRFARSLGEASRPGRRAAADRASVLVVSDPAFDSRTHPGLARLPAARVEADSIAMEYTNVTRLVDVAAQEDALEADLRRASILHFAGHAFYDGEHPAQSFLLLASSRGGGVLFATEMEKLDLGHLRLVVLAGCETLRSEVEWPAKSSGLASALLTAGASGVVGSRWRVNDDLTRALMIRFHREYKASGDAAGALREAQLAFLRSRDPPHRSAAAWAAFEYMGN